MTDTVLRIEGTDRSPFVLFDPSAGRLEMRGESYPEDAAGFFGPLLGQLETYLSGGRRLTAELWMDYFNSSSAKALMNMFQLFEDRSGGGAAVTVNWYFHEDDDTMREFGEDFAGDFSHAAFNMCPREAS